jgi:hypothetical protein
MSVFPAPCAISPADKRAQARKVGQDLIRHHGKQRQYTIQQVKDANLRQGIGIDVACWSHAMFNTHAQFDSLHPGLGDACDYISMKREMLDAASVADHVPSWFDFDLSWIEFPDLDWSIFSFFD